MTAMSFHRDCEELLIKYKRAQVNMIVDAPTAIVIICVIYYPCW